MKIKLSLLFSSLMLLLMPNVASAQENLVRESINYQFSGIETDCSHERGCF